MNGQENKPGPRGPGRMTIREVARRAGVSHAVVSAVLNENFRSIRVSEDTRRRVRQVIRDCRYYPDAVGKALTTRRTGHLGFILSDNIADGWGNAVYSQVLAGVEDACRHRGYGLNISRYNLSNLDSFVFPKRVGQRSVDGLVLTGYVETGVVQRFYEFGIPCVSVGDNVETAGLIPTVACDIVDGLFQAVWHAASLGHRKILYGNEQSRRAAEVAELLLERMRQDSRTRECRLCLPRIQGYLGNYDSAAGLVDYWVATPPEARATMLLGSDQVLVALLAELSRRGVSCPGEVSLIATCNSRLCEFSSPRLTAIAYEMEAYGRTAAEMLIDHLDEGAGLDGSMSRVEPCGLVHRNSCGPPAAGVAEGPSSSDGSSQSARA
ncbi:MAG: LacI family transcriptional regulator [Phycisphaerae bacterium]|nr:LacI family transcriptional regulator [Phycisphaerae bacterium]